MLYALQQQSTIVTKDEDFPHRLSQSVTAPVIVWLRIGNTSRKALLQWFEPLLPQIVQHIRQASASLRCADQPTPVEMALLLQAPTGSCS